MSVSMDGPGGARPIARAEDAAPADAPDAEAPLAASAAAAGVRPRSLGFDPRMLGLAAGLASAPDAAQAKELAHLAHLSPKDLEKALAGKSEADVTRLMNAEEALHGDKSKLLDRLAGIVSARGLPALDAKSRASDAANAAAEAARQARVAKSVDAERARLSGADLADDPDGSRLRAAYQERPQSVVNYLRGLEATDPSAYQAALARVKRDFLSPGGMSAADASFLDTLRSPASQGGGPTALKADVARILFERSQTAARAGGVASDYARQMGAYLSDPATLLETLRDPEGGGARVEAMIGRLMDVDRGLAADVVSRSVTSFTRDAARAAQAGNREGADDGASRAGDLVGMAERAMKTSFSHDAEGAMEFAGKVLEKAVDEYGGKVIPFAGKAKEIAKAAIAKAIGFGADVAKTSLKKSADDQVAEFRDRMKAITKETFKNAIDPGAIVRNAPGRESEAHQRYESEFEHFQRAFIHDYARGKDEQGNL